jgi:hypothetical protein
MDFKETVFGGVHWTELVAERVKWQAAVKRQIKGQRISCVVEPLSASQEGSYAMELNLGQTY